MASKAAEGVVLANLSPASEAESGHWRIHVDVWQNQYIIVK